MSAPRFMPIALLVALLAAGCEAASERAPLLVTDGQRLPIAVAARPLAAPGQACADTFVTHTLDHTTTMDDSPMLRVFESNGAGLAINDLDNDGDLDLVLANLQGDGSIFWNQGDLAFRKAGLPHGDSRAAQVVDVDGDGWQDIVLTRRLGRPTLWRNLGRRSFDADEQAFGGLGSDTPSFVQATLPGVYFPAYAMAWGDVDGDGRLDVVTGSYDAALGQAQIANPNTPFGGSVGVYFYARQGDAFFPQQLSAHAQALALMLSDLNGDGRPDILVGNDFDLPDAVWLRTPAGWAAVEPFVIMSRNTMSLDVGDIDNDGQAEVFAADMKPYDRDTRTLAAWLPMMQVMSRKVELPDRQINENTLQVRGPDGRFRNQGYNRDVDATGWSWSAKFGDLDRDGFMDLYVVNGMIGAGLFDHLPNRELVEQNQALRNDGRGRFLPAPEWGLGATASGRGMSMADLDDDGDLDVVINNVGSPALLLENQLCGGASLLVDLAWPASHNTRALGARLALHTSTGSYYRDVRSGSGYLSGDPARVHFGFPAEAVLQRLDIIWPDGAVSSVEAPSAQSLITATRNR